MRGVMPPDPVELRVLLRSSALELRALAAHRRRLAASPRTGWRGVRRAAFDEELARVDAETARLCDLLDAVARRAATDDLPHPGAPR
jgi:uncharacterized protein YukE